MSDEKRRDLPTYTSKPTHKWIPQNTSAKIEKEKNENNKNNKNIIFHIACEGRLHKRAQINNIIEANLEIDLYQFPKINDYRNWDNDKYYEQKTLDKNYLRDEPIRTKQNEDAYHQLSDDDKCYNYEYEDYKYHKNSFNNRDYAERQYYNDGNCPYLSNYGKYAGREELQERDRGRKTKRDKDKDRDGHRDGNRDGDRDGNRDGDRDGDRDKDRSRNRERERSIERRRDRDRDKDRERDRDRDRDKDRERDKDRDRDKERDNDRDRDKERDNDRYRYKERDNDRYRYKEREKEKERERYTDRGREQERNKDRKREREREREFIQTQQSKVETEEETKSSNYSDTDESYMSDTFSENENNTSMNFSHRRVSVGDNMFLNGMKDNYIKREVEMENDELFYSNKIEWEKRSVEEEEEEEVEEVEEEEGKEQEKQEERKEQERKEREQEHEEKEHEEKEQENKIYVNDIKRFSKHMNKMNDSFYYKKKGRKDEKWRCSSDIDIDIEKRENDAYLSPKFQSIYDKFPLKGETSNVDFLKKSENKSNTDKIEQDIINKYEKILKIMKYLKKQKMKYPEIEKPVTILSRRIKDVTFNCEKMFSSKSYLNLYLKEVYDAQIYLLKDVVFKKDNFLKENYRLKKYGTLNPSGCKMRFNSIDLQGHRNTSTRVQDTCKKCSPYCTLEHERYLSSNERNKTCDRTNDTDNREQNMSFYTSRKKHGAYNRSKNFSGHREGEGVEQEVTEIDKLEKKKYGPMDEIKMYKQGTNIYSINPYEEIETENTYENTKSKNRDSLKNIFDDNHEKNKIGKTKMEYDMYSHNDYENEAQKKHKWIGNEESKSKTENIEDLHTTLDIMSNQQSIQQMVKTRGSRISPGKEYLREKTEHNDGYDNEDITKETREKKKNFHTYRSQSNTINSLRTASLTRIEMKEKNPTFSNDIKSDIRIENMQHTPDVDLSKYPYRGHNDENYMKDQIQSIKSHRSQSIHNMNLNALNLEYDKNLVNKNQSKNNKEVTSNNLQEAKKTHVLYVDINKEMSIISNKENVTDALKHTLLNSPKHVAHLQKFLFKIEVELVEYKNFVLLITKDIRKPHLEALYGLNDFSVYEKVYGKKKAPRFLMVNKVKKFYRYDSYNKSFRELEHTRQFSGITDAVQLF